MIDWLIRRLFFQLWLRRKLHEPSLDTHCKTLLMGRPMEAVEFRRYVRYITGEDRSPENEPRWQPDVDLNTQEWWDG
jgi:hypothetical protein